jgi:hypothetical protein
MKHDPGLAWAIIIFGTLMFVLGWKARNYYGNLRSKTRKRKGRGKGWQ